MLVFIKDKNLSNWIKINYKKELIIIIIKVKFYLKLKINFKFNLLFNLIYYKSNLKLNFIFKSNITILK